MSGDLYEDIRRARQGDREAAGKLVEENAGLIWSVARRYFGRGVDPEDLYQLGCVGFLKAIEGFDESFGTRFSTYAVPKISGEIRRFLRDDGMVKVSRGIKEQADRLCRDCHRPRRKSAAGERGGRVHPGAGAGGLWRRGEDGGACGPSLGH